MPPNILTVEKHNIYELNIQTFDIEIQSQIGLEFFLKECPKTMINAGLFIERFFGGQLRLVASEALSLLENP